MSDDSRAELEVENQVVKVLSNYFPANRHKIKMNSRLVEDLYMDSIGFVEIVMELNETFGIELSVTEAGEWKTVNDICLLVKKAAYAFPCVSDAREGR